MRLWTFAALSVLLCGCFTTAFGQDLRSGFVVVTPVSTSSVGLIATETLSNQSFAGFSQAQLAPAIPTRNAAMPVNVGPSSSSSSAIAIVNPSTTTANVNVIMTGTQGNVILSTSFTILSGRQFSVFINDFFVNQPPPSITITALLSI